MQQGKRLRTRPVGAVGAGWVIAGMAAALPIAAAAHDDHAPPAAAQVKPGAADSMTVVRDAETGQLRAPTAEEAAALLQAPSAARSAVRVAPAALLPRVHWTGARGSRLTDDSLSHTVLVRQPDGALAARCYGSREEAEAAVRAAGSLVQIQNAPTE